MMTDAHEDGVLWDWSDHDGERFIPRATPLDPTDILHPPLEGDWVKVFRFDTSGYVEFFDVGIWLTLLHKAQRMCREQSDVFSFEVRRALRGARVLLANEALSRPLARLIEIFNLRLAGVVRIASGDSVERAAEVLTRRACRKLTTAQMDQVLFHSDVVLPAAFERWSSKRLDARQNLIRQWHLDPAVLVEDSVAHEWLTILGGQARDLDLMADVYSRAYEAAGGDPVLRLVTYRDP